MFILYQVKKQVKSRYLGDSAIWFLTILAKLISIVLELCERHWILQSEIVSKVRNRIKS